MKFIIAIEPGTKRTAHGVAVPDLPGCFSAGDSVEEAFDNAAQAIELHCELLAEDGGDLPTLEAMTEHQANREYKGWVWGVVDVPIERYFGPAEKVNITVPARVLPLGSNPLGHLLEAPGVGQAQAPKARADALILGRTRPERDRR